MQQIARFGVILRFVGLLSSLTQISWAVSACPKAVTVALRYDDCQSASINADARVIELLREHHVSCTFAIIPLGVSGAEYDSGNHSRVPLSPYAAGILREAIRSGTVDPALHGLSHQSLTGAETVAGYAEFRGGYDAQLARLARGKRVLEEALGVPVTTFVPPWNAYDRNTVRALNELHFRCLSAGLSGPSDAALPEMAPITTSIMGLREALRNAEGLSDPHPVVIVMFHKHDFVEFDRTRGQMSLRQFDDLLRSLKSQRHVTVTSIGGLGEAGIDLSASRFVANLDRRILSSPLLTAVHSPSTVGVYLSREGAEVLPFHSAKWLLVNAVLVALLAGIGGHLAARFVCLFPKYDLILRWVSAFLACAVLALALRQPALVGDRKLLAILVTSGGSIGIWLQHFGRRRNEQRGRISCGSRDAS